MFITFTAVVPVIIVIVNVIIINQRISTQGWVTFPEDLQCRRCFLLSHVVGAAGIQGQRPGMLLHILPRTGQLPSRHDLVPMPVAWRLRNWCEETVLTGHRCCLEVFPSFWCFGITVLLLPSRLKTAVLQNDEFFRTFCLSYLCSVPSGACARLCWGANGLILLGAFTSIRQMFVFGTSWML